MFCKLLRIYFWIGMVLVVFLVLVCIIGVLFVFGEEFQVEVVFDEWYVDMIGVLLLFEILLDYFEEQLFGVLVNVIVVDQV